jgi:hypothetical protein
MTGFGRNDEPRRAGGCLAAAVAILAAGVVLVALAFAGLGVALYLFVTYGVVGYPLVALFWRIGLPARDDGNSLREVGRDGPGRNRTHPVGKTLWPSRRDVYSFKSHREDRLIPCSPGENGHFCYDDEPSPSVLPG